MNRLLLVLAVIAFACTCGTEAARRRGLRVKFNVGLRPGTDFFFDVPRTVLNAIFNSWSVTQGVANLPNSNLTMYCHPDRVLCGFFDSTDRIAGLQIALDQSLFSNAVYDWKTQGYTEWRPPVSFGQTRRTYWTTQIFFVSPGSPSLTEYDPMNDFESVIREEKILVTGFNGQLVTISENEEDIKNSIFTVQACIPWMGRHYYYNMTSSTPCTSEGIFPWFPLVDSGKLEGVGFLVAGKLEIPSGRRDWFEHPDEAAVKAIVPNGPQCLYDLAKNNGVVTMHIYFTDQPWYIGCPLW
ncbi:unnamed protein product [Leptosia nina]|uniref:Uncharacterized protein n=1 Tax=Leptosia nina TaxID=320188 RepID=A0AAV1JSG0_9NEOP